MTTDRDRKAADLHATSDSIAADAERVAELEKAKGQLPPAHPAVERLSGRVQQLVEKMRVEATAERELATEIQAERPQRPN